MGRARTAVVTGSARRVGRAIAAALVADGWRVLFHAREGARAREACEAAGGEGAGMGWVGADLLRAEATDEIAAAATATFGDAGLDLLVNSAASFERVDSWDAAGIDGWQRAMAVNARAPYLLTCALLPMLRANGGGLVVNVSDHAAQEHWPAYPIHSASKAALESLTLSGAVALAHDGVRFVAVSPGTILMPDEWDDEQRARHATTRPVGTPDQLVATILAFAADPTRSGEVVVID